MKIEIKIIKMIAVYLILSSFAIQSINSKTSILWRVSENKIIAENDISHSLKSPASNLNKNDEIFNIITSTHGSTTWIKNCESNTISSTVRPSSSVTQNSRDESTKVKLKNSTENTIIESDKTTSLFKNNNQQADILDCGKPVNFTYYDYLIGVSNRFNHPLAPEPDVQYLFLKSRDDRKAFDLNALEKRLHRARKEKPRSVSIFNQIGNYWRIKGDARQSIECFRRALAIAPTNADVLLNLAGVLFHLQYLDDAIHLTRRSLEVHPPSSSAWRQYLTLGEIFKAYGHFQESLSHLRHALEVYPHNDKNAEHHILKILKEVESSPASPLHAYTLIIIFALVIAVFIVMLNTSTENSNNGNISQNEFEPKIQRHFNRAMAMKSLKGFSSTRNNFKHRKY